MKKVIITTVAVLASLALNSCIPEGITGRLDAILPIQTPNGPGEARVGVEIGK